jgi:hypothetical protein
MIRLSFALLASFALAGCAASTPPSQAEAADAAACTAQADATYKAQNYAQLSRTSQNGLRYGATPTHVFDGEQLGALHQRDSQITNCEETGSGGVGPGLPGAMPVTPQIVP